MGIDVSFGDPLLDVAGRCWTGDSEMAIVQKAERPAVR